MLLGVFWRLCGDEREHFLGLKGIDGDWLLAPCFLVLLVRAILATDERSWFFRRNGLVLSPLDTGLIEFLTITNYLPHTFFCTKDDLCLFLFLLLFAFLPPKILKDAEISFLEGVRISFDVFDFDHLGIGRTTNLYFFTCAAYLLGCGIFFREVLFGLILRWCFFVGFGLWFLFWSDSFFGRLWFVCMRDDLKLDFLCAFGTLIKAGYDFVMPLYRNFGRSIDITLLFYDFLDTFRLFGMFLFGIGCFLLILL